MHYVSAGNKSSRNPWKGVGGSKDYIRRGGVEKNIED